jgi:hypothetical protein
VHCLRFTALLLRHCSNRRMYSSHRLLGAFCGARLCAVADAALGALLALLEPAAAFYGAREEEDMAWVEQDRALRERLAAREVALPGTKEQLRSVTARLAGAEDSRGRLSAECTALRHSLEQERRAHAAVAEELLEMRAREAEGDREGSSEALDVEAGGKGGGGGGGSGSSSSSSSGPRLSRRAGAATRVGNLQLTPMSRLKAFGQGKQMESLAEGLDSLAAWMVRSLLKSPTARLVFFAWLALVHLGTFWLVLFHVHGLQHDKHALPTNHLPH